MPCAPPPHTHSPRFASLVILQARTLRLGRLGVPETRQSQKLKAPLRPTGWEVAVWVAWPPLGNLPGLFSRLAQVLGGAWPSLNTA